MRVVRKASISHYRGARRQFRSNALSDNHETSKSPIAWFVEIVSLLSAIGTVLSVLIFNSLLSDGKIQYIQFASLADMLRDALALTILAFAPLISVAPFIIAIILVILNVAVYNNSPKMRKQKILASVAVITFLLSFALIPMSEHLLDAVFGFSWRIKAPLWALILANGLMFTFSIATSVVVLREAVPDSTGRTKHLIAAFLQSRIILYVFLAMFVVSVVFRAGSFTQGEGQVHSVMDRDLTSEVYLACHNSGLGAGNSELTDALLVWSGERAIVVRCTFQSQEVAGLHEWDLQVVVLNPGRIAL